LEVNGNPHMCLFSIREIIKGEELRYNYDPIDGGKLPWRKVYYSLTAKLRR